jgi:hypothetical protein
VSPEATVPDQDALALVAGIERASRRSRPFFLVGLLAVILGFASVSVYLYQDREEERAQKIVLERQVGELTRTLNEARALWPSLDDSPAARDRLRILLGEAIGTVRALPADVAQAESEVAVSSPAAPPPAPPSQARPRPQRPSPGADRPERPPERQRPGARRPDQGARRPRTSM